MVTRITGVINPELFDKWREQNPEYDLKNSQIVRYVMAIGCGYSAEVAEIVAKSTPTMTMHQIETIAKGLANVPANA